MKIAIANDKIIIKDMSPSQWNILKNSGLFKYERTLQAMTAPTSLQIIDIIETISIGLPPAMKTLKQQLQSRQARVDKLRAQTPAIPIVDYPIKATLYQHQIKAANMALVTLGII